jgi:hypothetical protein
LSGILGVAGTVSRRFIYGLSDSFDAFGKVELVYLVTNERYSQACAGDGSVAEA